jgi:DNA-directed RNA polymerase subunit RPC12/RpoP
VACRYVSVLLGRFCGADKGETTMDDSQNWGEELGNAIVDLMRGMFWAMVVYLIISAIVAAVIAEKRGRSPLGFFFATLLFLGPLGVGVALLATRGELDEPPPAPPKRKVAEGRQRFVCPRCGAESDIPNSNTSYDCWRCGEHRKVKPKATATSEAAKS